MGIKKKSKEAPSKQNKVQQKKNFKKDPELIWVNFANPPS
jgi:hypothetical protein